MPIAISVVILTKNSAYFIGRCLDALVDFDDVVVYDNGSTDETRTICMTYKNVHLVEGDFLGFGPTKNAAASFAKYSWVLSLDSDELLSEALMETLKYIKLTKNTIYMIERKNFYKNKEIKYSWKNDKVLRLYNQEDTHFNNNMVHESVMVSNLKIQMLHGFIKHYSYQSIDDFIKKIDRYSTLFAEQNTGIQHSTPLKAILHANFAFLKSYFIKRGFLDGYIGLIIAYSQASEKFYKYMKLYEANKEQ